MHDLKVCEKCGWYDHGPYRKNECDPELGAIADKLSKAVPVPSTKLGYGFGNLTFEFSKNQTLTVGVNEDGTFRIDKLFVLEDPNEAGMVAIINALRNVLAGG